MLARSQSRCDNTTLISIAIMLVALWAWSGHAAATDATTAVAAVKCATPELLRGFSAAGATVTTPGAKPRTLDKDQATAFMQTWLAYSVFGKPAQERPPPQLPISHLNVAVVENGRPTSLLIFYASDGNNAWVGAPAPAPPPNDQKWIRAPRPEQTIAAFAGTMAPICTPTTPTSTLKATTATTVGHGATGASSGNGVPWALTVGGIAIVAGGALVATRSLRRRAG